MARPEESQQEQEDVLASNFGYLQTRGQRPGTRHPRRRDAIVRMSFGSQIRRFCVCSHMHVC